MEYLDTEVGYIGGITNDPSYHDVCSGETGHAEAVRVKFDEDIVSYEELVSLFFKMHDPTTLNRQVQTLEPNIDQKYFA